jgi:hypothetical protein
MGGETVGPVTGPLIGPEGAVTSLACVASEFTGASGMCQNGEHMILCKCRFATFCNSLLGHLTISSYQALRGNSTRLT